ncbi:xanthine dehydrogenase family protein molybdopterin-binding subunit [Acuticoccus mangrovi]|uniref:Xanthine dehydrogenase family protein molybdopterin-binding subunit n=1 Tax=Acuticoccus mangrovi TaxID=2796142 RepID=A0A934IQS1_9HYPH|nr:xanthine dehydrogenase family protein molybdopterin-binding subunit [Acuticoccus mangrovi]MBJ3776991.1 xanthine dehydrogenase family protein molybdopterin-binding subunit [Acuticoccus mangrovi]
MTLAERPAGVGISVPRLEDDALVRGKGRFLDDITLPGLLHAAFLRSPEAHGHIRSIDVAEAEALPGVHRVLRYEDLRPLLTMDRIPVAMPSGALKFDVDPFVLARDEVCHVGEPIALILAESRHVAEDAAELIMVDIDPLPAVVDPRDGLAPDAPQARLDCPDNLVARTSAAYGDIDAAFADAPVRFAERFHLHKGGGNSIEPRGVVARWDPMEERLTVWNSTQMPHRAKRLLVTTLGLTERQVRVVPPDVGGGFGPKFVFHPEELAIAAAAKLTGLPVKWAEDRYESFIATVQERDQFWSMEVAADADGRLRGLRGTLVHDHGAYTPYGVALPYNSATNLLGPYVLPAYALDISLCLTNKVPTTPTRGAGRPQGTFIMERILDLIAERLGLARDEVRRRNLIAAERLPFRTGLKTRDGGEMTYDSGDYAECQRRALAAADWNGFPERRAAARREGRFLGIGLANYVEGTGRGPFESASVTIGPSGEVVVTTGACGQGQGTVTMLAQLTGAALGIAPAKVRVIAGDTDASPLGLGAFASRQAVTAGSAVHLAAGKVRDKILAVASDWLEVAAEDLELIDGRVSLRGAPEVGRSIADIAAALSGSPGFSLPKGAEPGLSAAADFQPDAITYCNGTHVAEAEVDPFTGVVRLTRYVVVHDCGRLINPRMVDGQIIGGVVHGIGSALYEWMRYDATGQPLTCTYSDYLLATADVVPRVEVHHMESPTPLNPLGVKGAGESGTIAAPAVVASAVEDALRPLGVAIRDLPMTPDRLVRLARQARAAA